VSSYNNGPVGPAFDWKTYDGTVATRTAYWANWTVNGDVKRIDGASWAVTEMFSFTERVTAIAFGRRDYSWKSISNGSLKKQRANSLYIAHGTTLTIINIDTPPSGYEVNPLDPIQIDIDVFAACEATSCSLICQGGSHNGLICADPLDASCTSGGGTCSTTDVCFGPHGGGTCTTVADCHGCGPEAPTAIQSIAPNPLVDEAWLVVKGTSDTFIVEVRPRAKTVRRGIDAQDQLALTDPACFTGNADNPATCATCPTYSCIPTAVNTLDAKLTFDPFGNLIWIGLGNTLGSKLQAVERYTASHK
jgi:hypothetical protein